MQERTPESDSIGRAAYKYARSRAQLSGRRPDLGQASEIRPDTGHDHVARRLRCCSPSLFRIRIPVPTAPVPTAVPTVSRCGRPG